MTSKIEIWNMALGHLGHADEIQDIDEGTTYAIFCRRYWDVALQDEYEEYNYPYFRVQKVLAEIEEDPTD